MEIVVNFDIYFFDVKFDNFILIILILKFIYFINLNLFN